MTDSGDQDPTTRERSGTVLSRCSCRTLLGFVVVLWTAGSLSNARTARLLYVLNGYGQFGFGGPVSVEDDDE